MKYIRGSHSIVLIEIYRQYSFPRRSYKSTYHITIVDSGSLGFIRGVTKCIIINCDKRRSTLKSTAIDLKQECNTNKRIYGIIIKLNNIIVNNYANTDCNNIISWFTSYIFFLLMKCMINVGTVILQVIAQCTCLYNLIYYHHQQCSSIPISHYHVKSC